MMVSLSSASSATFGVLPYVGHDNLLFFFFFCFLRSIPDSFVIHTQLLKTHYKSLLSQARDASNRSLLGMTTKPELRIRRWM